MRQSCDCGARRGLFALLPPWARDLRQSLKRSVEFSELDRVHVLDCSGGGNNVTFTGLERNALGDNLLADLLGLSLDQVILLNALSESLSGLGLADVLNTYVDALGDDARVNSLVDDNSDTVAGNIEDLTSLSVIELEGKTSLDGTVGNNVDNIILFEVSEHLGQGRLTVLSEGNTEEMSSASSLTGVVGHFFFKIQIIITQP